MDEPLAIPIDAPEEDAHKMREALDKKMGLAAENARTRLKLRSAMRENETLTTANRHLSQVIDVMHALVVKGSANV